MPERPQLRVVDASTGELLASCPGCAELEDEIAGLNKDLRAWRSRYAKLARDAERDAREHRNWAAVAELFDFWRSECKHPRSRLNAERFALAQPYLDKDGAPMCRRAIQGAAFDPFITHRKNGKPKRHDGWDLIFRSREKFEEFCNRAPEPIAADDLHKLATQRLGRIPEDDRSSEERIMQAVGEAQEILRERSRRSD